MISTDTYSKTLTSDESQLTYHMIRTCAIFLEVLVVVVLVAVVVVVFVVVVVAVVVVLGVFVVIDTLHPQI